MCEYGCYHAGPIDWSWLKGALLVLGLLSLAFVAGCGVQAGANDLLTSHEAFTTDDGVRCIAYSRGGIDCDFASPQPTSDLRQGAFVP